MKLNFDLNKAFWFVQIVDAGNITKAAQLLNEPKAKLSRYLSLLEEELGVQLVYRTTRQFKLTETGLLFYNKVKGHVQGLVDVTFDLSKEREEVSGTIRITAPDDIGVFVVTEIINDFAAIHPKVSFELSYTNEILDIVKLGVDLAIRIGHLKDSTLIQKKAGTVDFILVASPRYLDRSTPLTEVTDLPLHQTIGFSSKDSSAWTLVSRAKKVKVKLKHKFLVNNFIAIRDLAIKGRGICYLPRFLCESYLASGELVHILREWSDEGSPIQLAVPQQKIVSKKVRTFMNFATKRLSEKF